MMPSTFHDAGTFEALGHRYTIDCDDAAVSTWLAEILGHLSADGDASGADRALTRYRLMHLAEADNAEWVVQRGTDHVTSSKSASTALAYLLWLLNQDTIAASADRFLLVHSGAVEIDGAAVVLPAPMESGKTTLTAGLVTRGAGYLTDEAAAIHPTELTVQPYPKPLSVDEGSYEVLAHLRPDLPDGMDRYVEHQWHVPPAAFGPSSIGAAAPLGLIVLPRYVEGSTTESTPISPAEAAVALLENSFNGADLGETAFRAACAAARTAPAHRLVVGDLADACTEVARLRAALPSDRAEAAGGGPIDLPAPDPATTAPARRGDVVAERVGDDVVLYDPVTADLHVLNQAAASLWVLLDGDVDVDAISRDLAEMFQASSDQVAADVAAALDDLGAQGLLAAGADRDPAPR